MLSPWLLTIWKQLQCHCSSFQLFSQTSDVRVRRVAAAMDASMTFQMGTDKRRSPLYMRRSAGFSPERYGLNMGHAGIGSNWLQFMDRMGMNYARIFVSIVDNLRSARGSTFGRALDGSSVNSLTAYKRATAQIRSAAGGPRHARSCEVRPRLDAQFQ